MSKRETPPHEVARLEVLHKFLYFIRDMGIKTAHEPAVKAWQEYVIMQSHLAASHPVVSS